MEYLGNTISAYFWALILLLLLVVGFKVFATMLVVKLKRISEKTQNIIDDAVIQVISSIRFSFYIFLSFWVALKLLNTHEMLDKVVDAILIVWVVYVVSQAVKILVDYYAKKRIEADGEQTTMMVGIIRQMMVATIWLFGVLLLLSNLGINVTSLIAGLGIGGIAIALAVQNILGDLFSSIAIFLDKPFEVGDFITVGKNSGTVKRVGIKTTRLKSPQGEELVISNKELTSARIQNFRKLDKRRINFIVGVAYETSQDIIEKIPLMTKNIIDKVDKAEFLRAHLVEFGDSALKFEVVYYVLSREFSVYRDVHQEILFAINTELRNQNIELAYPTQTVHLAK